MKRLWPILLVCSIAAAQPFGAGIKIGAPITDAISIVNGASPDTSISNDHYIVGPYGEVRLPSGFSIEIDALYRSFSSTVRGSSVVSGGTWEFPVLAKKKLFKGPVRPYIEGGLVLSHLTGSDLNVAHASNYGITLGAGIEIHALVLRISPEVRYDGFFFNTFSSNSFVQSNRNQVLVMVGIGF